jgi:hypothetical protein
MHHIVPTLQGDADAPPSAVPIERVEPCGRPVTGLGAGDSAYYPDLLTAAQIAQAIAALSPGGEVAYQQWYHMPDPKRPARALRPLRRIKAAMATAPDSDRGVPHYRFPVNDQCRYGVTSPMSPAVDALRLQVEARTGCSFNHAVVLVYRDGEDSIGFHKDKVLDLDPEAPIACVSLGARRLLALRDDIFQPTRQQEVLLESGSLYVLGPMTNLELYHSIPRAEGAAGPRISVTFRRASTFLRSTGEVCGQGAQYQTPNWPVELRGGHRTDERLDQDAPET